jgi:signal transduction histidine kinase
MNIGIRTRLTLSHLAVIVTAMGLSGFLLLSFLERYFLQAMENSLVAQARITAQALIPGTLAGGPAITTAAPAYNTIQQQGNLALQTQNSAPPPSPLSATRLDLAYLTNASLQLSAQLDTRIRILDTQGAVLVDSQLAPTTENLLADPLVTQALAGSYASRVDPSRTAPTPMMHLALPVLVEGQVAGVVYLDQSLSDVTAVLYDLRLRWLLSTLIALLLSGLAGWLLSRAIARPLHQLTQAAGAVAQGRLDQQVPITSRDELGRLSATFNEMTSRLQAARQMQIDMVANVSHELRTPLTSIKGLLETLRAGAVDDLQVRDSFLETTEQETDRLIRLVNDLLLLSRADSAALNLQRQEVDLEQLVQQIIGRMQPQAAERGLTLHLKANPHLPLVWADPDRVLQILLNLLDNAIQYSSPGGAITFNLSLAEPEWLQVALQDEGIGIPATELERIGQRFYRADRARTRAQGGHGLGLAIAQALVKAHGGRLRLTSQEGQGTTVTFTLPATTHL